MNAEDVLKIVNDQLDYFESKIIKAEFKKYKLNTPYSVKMGWDYSKVIHDCWIVAEDNKSIIVFCKTGFGPDFQWSVMPKTATILGTDGQWDAYLFEAFVSSDMCKNKINIIKMGPGDRNKI